MVEVTSKRLTARIGDKVVVTDIDICQRLLPAEIDFKGILQVVKVEGNWASVEFEGYETDRYAEPEEDVEEVKLAVAAEIADMLEGDGATVIGRPET